MWLIVLGRKCERDIVVSDEVTVLALDVATNRKWPGHAVVLRAASSVVGHGQVGLALPSLQLPGHHWH